MQITGKLRPGRKNIERPYSKIGRALFSESDKKYTANVV